jgi:hypothetical protein
MPDIVRRYVKKELSCGEMKSLPADEVRSQPVRVLF